MADHWLYSIMTDIVVPLAPYLLLPVIGWFIWLEGRNLERLGKIEKGVRHLRRDVAEMSRGLRGEIRCLAEEMRKEMRATSRAINQLRGIRAVEPLEHTNGDGDGDRG